MAVTLPSDLIADVMRNADPSRLNSAVKRLHDLSSDPIPEEFQSVLSHFGEVNTASGDVAQHLGTVTTTRTQSSGHPVQAGAAEPPAHVAFERMVLRNLLESLLPDADTGVFGTGPSAGVWRSLAADQLAGLYADTGGIGIAATLSKEEHEPGAQRRSEWPYFDSEKIVAFAG
jgi:flagellar protein FlgJ